MSVRAVIFDLGGVLIEIDWERLREDQASEIMSQELWPYEKLNVRMLQLLKQLRPAYTLATICNGGLREGVERKFRLGSLVDLMAFDGEEGVSRSDGSIYWFTLERLNVRPEEALFVDSKRENVEAARCLGMHVIHFKDVRQAIAEIEATLSL